MNHLKSNQHKKHVGIILQKNVEKINSAFKNRIVSYKVTTDGFYINIMDFFEEILDKVKKILTEELVKHFAIKFNIELFGIYFNPTHESYEVKSFNTAFRVVCNSSEFETDLSEMIQIIDRKSDEIAEKNSGKIICHFLF